MNRNSGGAILFAVLSFCLLTSPTSRAYKNYTVGDDLGWYDNIEKPQLTYQKWVANKNFSLGDFLIFNTDTNHSVVRTYNFTIYKRCDFSSADSSDTVEYSSGYSTNGTAPANISVPLIKEGMNYFFSGYFDGEQCRKGQRFKINVTHGEGLPEALKSLLKSPSPPPPPPQGPQGGQNSGTVPANPSGNPVPSQAANQTSEGGFRHVMLDRFGMLLLLGMLALRAV